MRLLVIQFIFWTLVHVVVIFYQLICKVVVIYNQQRRVKPLINDHFIVNGELAVDSLRL